MERGVEFDCEDWDYESKIRTAIRVAKKGYNSAQQKCVVPYQSEWYDTSHHKLQIIISMIFQNIRFLSHFLFITEYQLVHRYVYTRARR